MRKEVLYFRKKIVSIIGDLNVEDFGLSKNDKNILTEYFKITLIII